MCQSEAKISVTDSAVVLWSRLLTLPAVRMSNEEADASSEVQELQNKRLIRVVGHDRPERTLFISDSTLMLTRDERRVLEMILALDEPINVHLLILRAKRVYVLNPLRDIKRLIYLNLIELNPHNKNLIHPRFGVC
jgi:hypothetical protein